MKDNQKVKLTKKENLMQMFKFFWVSVSAGVIQILSFALLNEILKFDVYISQIFNVAVNLKYGPSYFIALILSVLYSFTVNRRYTFKSAANIPAALLKLTVYYIIFTPVSTIFGEYLAQNNWNEFLILVICMALNLITEYLVCRFIIYKNSINTNNKDKTETAETILP